MIGKIIWRISSVGRGPNSALQMYYAQEIFARDVLIWWLAWDKQFPSWTWKDIKVVLRRRFVLHLSRKKVAILMAQNLSPPSRFIILRK